MQILDRVFDSGYLMPLGGMPLMKNKSYEGVWVRVAGHAQMIRNKSVYRWRCFIGGSLPEINLSHWEVTGEVTPTNMIAGTNPVGEANGLVAWIDFYGNAFIDEHNVLHISARQPTRNAPAG